MILITQCSYYNAKNARLSRHRTRRRASREEPPAGSGASEHSPLLSRRDSSSAGHRHESRKASEGADAVAGRPGLSNALALLAVWLVGGLGWFVSYKFGAWDVEPPAVPPAPEEEPTYQIGTVLGYTSAVFYLL